MIEGGQGGLTLGLDGELHGELYGEESMPLHRTLPSSTLMPFFSPQGCSACASGRPGAEMELAMALWWRSSALQVWIPPWGVGLHPYP